MLETSSNALREMPVTLEVANVATSEGPLGTVFGDQLAAVLQSLVVGALFQVALPANAGPAAKVASKTASSRMRERGVFFMGLILGISWIRAAKNPQRGALLPDAPGKSRVQSGVRLTDQYCSPSSSGAVTTRSGIAHTWTMTAIQ